MDPNTVLENIRSMVTEVNNPHSQFSSVLLVQELADSVNTLDEWLSKGGFPPAEWVHVRV